MLWARAAPSTISARGSIWTIPPCPAAISATPAKLRAMPVQLRQLATFRLSEEGRKVVPGDGGPTGTLIISAPETLCTYRLPVLLRAFRDQCPRVRLTFRPLPVADLRRRVDEGLLDVAFLLEEPLQAAGLWVEPLVPEPVVVIAPPDHPLAALPCVRPADLGEEDILLTELGCSYRNLFLRALAAEGIHPATTLEFNSIEAIKQCVMAGMGLAVLPTVSVAAERAAGRLVALPWAAGDLRVVAQMIRHRDKWVSPALAAVLQQARAVLGGATGPAAAATARSIPASDRSA